MPRLSTTRNEMKSTFPKEVYINGTWKPHSEAFVSVFDRGFLFGDGIYEVIPVYDNKPFTLDEHVRRMQEGLTAIGVSFDVSTLAEVVWQAVEKAGFPEGEGCVYLQVTRGVAPRAHRFPSAVEPTVIAYGFPFTFSGFERKTAQVLLSRDERWHKCNIKSISLVANVMANQQAHSLGADENVMIRDGYLTEGSHTNVFFVKNGVVYTHPLGPHILPGITRKLVLQFCENEGVPVREEAVHLSELPTMDEAFLSGTTTQVLAVGRIMHEGKQLFASHQAGAVTTRIQEAFIYQIRQFIEGIN